MEVRYLPNPDAYKRMTTAELRKEFLVDKLFKPGIIYLLYTDADRAIVGSAVPLKDGLELKGSKKEMATGHFAERREIGIINIGKSGKVLVDGQAYALKYKDALYIGMGAKSIQFESDKADNPAAFYILSYPAHKSYPTRLARFTEGETETIGSAEEASIRTLTKLIYPGGVESCQLVMGITELHSGCVWNTMSAHLHPRRTEIYMYFNLDTDARQFHIMGEPDETRHLVVANRQAVISPSWSIHSGAATQNYSFIWGMGGENQTFTDMDAVEMEELR